MQVEKLGKTIGELLLFAVLSCITLPSFAEQDQHPQLSIFDAGDLAPSPEPVSRKTVFQAHRIAIIIDDLGYHYQRSLAAVNLPGAVTLSVIPHSPHAVEVARQAHQQGKELMLHAPMSNILDKPLDRGALTSDMNRESFVQTLEDDLAAVPYIRGLNNHMGSQLTQEPEPMQWLMVELKARQLFFVDSRTSADSIAWDMAKADHIPSLKRDFFLDNDPDPVSIASQFAAFLQFAKQRGYALAIAHPYPETLNFLQSTLPTLENSEFHLLFVSNLLSSLEPQVITQQVSVGPP